MHRYEINKEVCIFSVQFFFVKYNKWQEPKYLAFSYSSQHLYTNVLYLTNQHVYASMFSNFKSHDPPLPQLATLLASCLLS